MTEDVKHTNHIDNMKNKRKVTFLCKKTADGKYRGILSSDSIDRDEERMSVELLKNWANSNVKLPILSDHKNTMESLVGYWKNLKYEVDNGVSFLVAEPEFIKTNNPMGDKIKAALEQGMNVGVSVGFIPKESREVNIGEKMIREYTRAELLESSFTPVQSNRDAMSAMAKSYNLMKKYDKGEKQYKEDGNHVHNENNPMGTHDHPEIESMIRFEVDYLIKRINELNEKIEPSIDESDSIVLSSADTNKIKTKDGDSMTEEEKKDVVQEEEVTETEEKTEEVSSDAEPVEETEEDVQTEEETEQEENPEKSANIDSIVSKAVDLKVKKLTETIDNQDKTIKSLNAKIKTLEDMPVYRTVNPQLKNNNVDEQKDVDADINIRKFSRV